MDDLKSNTRDLRSLLNGLFALFTAVKLLAWFMSYFGQDLISGFASEVSGVSAEDMSRKLLSSVTIPGILLDIAAAVFSVCVPAALYMAFARVKHPRNDFLRAPRFIECVYTVGGTMTFGYGLTFAASAIVLVIARSFGFSFSVGYADAPTNVFVIPLYLVYLAAVPAFSEELLMRRLALSRLSVYGVGFAVIITAVVFSFLHNSVEQLLFAFFMGLALAYFTLKFRSVWTAVIAHFCVNANAAVYRIALAGTTSAADVFFIIAFAVSVGIFAVSAAIAFAIVCGLRIPKEDSDERIENVSRAKALFTAPFFYVFILTEAAFIVFSLLRIF